MSPLLTSFPFGAGRGTNGGTSGSGGSGIVIVVIG
jgi:hypothetical protein